MEESDPLEGLVVTHRVSPEERSAGELEADPDLSVLGELAGDDERIPLAGGGFLEDRYIVLAGPAGWIPAGDQVALRVVRDEAHAGGLAVSVEPIDDLPPVEPEHAHLLLEALDDLTAADAPTITADLVLAARERDPAFLGTPAAPIEDILAVAGLYDADGETYLIGEGPDFYDEDDDLLDHLAFDHGFDAATIQDVLLVSNATLRLGTEALREVVLGLTAATDAPTDAAPTDAAPTPRASPELDDETAAALSRLVGSTDETSALLHDVVGADALAAASLLAMVDLVEVDLDRRGRANRHWLRAQLLEFVAEDHADAEEELRRAVELDPHHGAAAFALAGYRSDRGDARGALELVRQFELLEEDRDWIALLERYARPRQAAAGRNDPCPCGSGRKYKRCCADRVGWSLEERRDWLMDKVIRFATSMAALDTAAMLAEAAGLGDDVEGILEDEFLTSLLLFDAGTVADLVEVRGSLLPADERDFLARWGQVRVSAYEVVDIDVAAGGLTLLDRRDGAEARIEVQDRMMSAALGAGDLLLSWVAESPSGRLEPVLGGIVVPPDAVASAIELVAGDPEATLVAEWYADLTRA